MLTAAKRIIPSKSGCRSGAISKTRKKKEITRKIADAVGEAIRMPDVNSRIRESMAEPAGTSPDGMAALIRESYDRWSPVIISGRITAE